MIVLLDIKDSKADFFMELMKNFSFVKTKPFNQEKEKFLNSISEAVEEVKLHKQGKIKLKSARELLDEL
ncbi:MAG: hypothetical protein A2046_11960 [Bacteroidetes bacterium GWA2_30_7]|nr:MAG: hypothetical protein A2046_11960 [Bacteroidetes bacterium GWA2_30_7]